MPFYTLYSSSRIFLSCPFLPVHPVTPSSMTATPTQLRLAPEKGLHIMSCSLRIVSRPRCLFVILFCKIILQCVVCVANQDSPVTSRMCVVHPQRINPHVCRTAYSSVAWTAYEEGVQSESRQCTGACFDLVHRCCPDREGTIGLAVRKPLVWRSSTAMWSPSATLGRKPLSLRHWSIIGSSW